MADTDLPVFINAGTEFSHLWLRCYFLFSLYRKGNGSKWSFSILPKVTKVNGKMQIFILRIKLTKVVV